MEFRAWMKKKYLKEMMLCVAYRNGRGFGWKWQGVLDVSLGIILVAFVLVLWYLVWQSVRGPSVVVTVLLVIYILLGGGLVGVAYMRYLLHRQIAAAQKGFRPEMYDRTVRLDEKGISVTLDDGSFSVFVAWDQCTKAGISEHFYFFFSPRINLAFLKECVAGQEERVEGFLRTYVADAGKPVLREKG